MRNFKFLLALMVMLIVVSACKKQEAEPDPYAFLKGTWKYSNGAECVFDPTSKLAKGTKTPANDVFGFVVGEDYWRNVVSTGSVTWDYDQIVRYSDKKTIEYRKSKLVKKDENTLFITTPGLTDSELKRVII